MAIDAARAKSLFLAASDLPDLTARAAYLDRECGDDAELRGRVEALLRANDAAPLPPAGAGEATVDSEHGGPRHGATGEYTPQPDDVPSRAPGATDFRPEVEPGTVIAGRYALVEVIGEGGMGSVYLASQTEPVKRQVALKLIRSGMDSKAVLARFDAERQALALMDHPNIARIYDGGVTPAGQPFFVMELVTGVPLTEYCDAQRLSVAARLQLFVAVCQAVQHAHQKGIIHRDLKPGNVLVTEVDGRPTPKVIDFGVAKATEQKLTDLSFSDVGAIVGTPAYMSPEQADPSSMDIDTRTDVYALGVMLYELLTGSPPLDAAQFKRGAVLEMLRMVREVEPPRPSTRLSTADALPNIAANRSMDPAKLSKLLQGELDWVVMKALEKDRTRRYDTANGLARDIQRYLADEVVEARPPSAGYRLQKFVKRHKVQVIAASLVLFALLAGIASTTWGLLAEQRQRGRAEENETKALAAANAEKAANEQAQKRLVQIETINHSIFDLFGDFDVQKVKASGDPVEYVLAQRLVAMGKKLDTQAIEDPVMLASLHDKLGTTLHNLGRFHEAVAFLKQARAAREALLGIDNRYTLMTMNNLGRSYVDMRNLDEAVPLLEETLTRMRAVLGPDHHHTLTCMNNLATAYQFAGKGDLALPLFEESFKLRQAKFGTHDSTITSMGNLAESYLAAGKLDLALPLFEATVTRSKAKLGKDHPDTLISIGNLARYYVAAGANDQAVPLFEEVLSGMKARLGHDHPYTLLAMSHLASTYRDAKKYDKAIPLYEETFRLMKAKLGPDHPDTLTCMNNLAMILKATGKLDLALPLFEEGLKRKRARLGDDHSETLVGMTNLAGAYRELGKLDQALPLLEQAAWGVEKHHYQHRNTEAIMMSAIGAFKAAGQLDRANAWRDKWLVFLKTNGKGEADYANLLAGSALKLLPQKKWTDAESTLRECLAIREKLEPEAWQTFSAQSLLGGALLGQKNYADAEPLLLAGYEGMKQREQSIPPQGRPRFPEILDWLIELYQVTNKPDEVRKWQAERAKYPEK